MLDDELLAMVNFTSSTENANVCFHFSLYKYC